MHLLGRPDALPREETIAFVLSCQHENGGFGAAPGHDSHLLYTVSAVQVLVMVDALGELEESGKNGGRKGVARCRSLLFVEISVEADITWCRYCRATE